MSEESDAVNERYVDYELDSYLGKEKLAGKPSKAYTPHVVMKPETSQFIDKQAKVADIVKLLGLSLPYVKREECMGAGTYLYTFKRPAKLSVAMIRDLATQAMKSGQYPQLIAVFDVPHKMGEKADSKVQVELDPRDAKHRGKKPEARDTAAEQAIKHGLENQSVRAFKVRICGQSPKVVQAHNMEEIVRDLETKHGMVIHSVVEIPMLHLVVYILSGEYELYQTEEVHAKMIAAEKKAEGGQ